MENCFILSLHKNVLIQNERTNKFKCFKTAMMLKNKNKKKGFRSVPQIKQNKYFFFLSNYWDVLH